MPTPGKYWQIPSIMKQETKALNLPDGILQLLVLDELVTKPIRAAVLAGEKKSRNSWMILLNISD